MKEQVYTSWARSVATMMTNLRSHQDMKNFETSFNYLLTEATSKRTVHIEEGGDADKPIKGRPVPSKGDGLLTQDPSKSECKPNGQPLIRLPGDTKYGYQLAENGENYRAYRLSDCKFLGTFNDEDGLKKVKDAAGISSGPTVEEEGDLTQDEEAAAEVVENPPPGTADKLRGHLLNVLDAAAKNNFTRVSEDNADVKAIRDLLKGGKNLTIWKGISIKKLEKMVDY